MNHEKDISAEKKTAKQRTRFPQKDEYVKRTQGADAEAEKGKARFIGLKEKMKFVFLKARSSGLVI